MSVSFYMDEHVDLNLTQELRRRGVEVLTAQEDSRQETLDPRLLDRATELGRVFVTYDHDFLQEATFRQRNGIPFAGLIFARQRDVETQIGLWIEALELAGIAGVPEDFAHQVKYLPYLF